MATQFKPGLFYPFASQGAGRIMGALWNSQADKVSFPIRKNDNDHRDNDTDVVAGGGDNLQGGDSVGDDAQL